MTEKLLASAEIALFMNDIKEKIVEKLFLSLPEERQKEILIEIFKEEKKCDCQKTPTKGK